VRFLLYPNAATEQPEAVLPMRVDPATGVWTIVGEPNWADKYYLYEVQVFVPAENGVRTNLVTDPYSLSLSLNSTRSQIVDLNALELQPQGWDTFSKPPLLAPEDIVIYELHVRDFSVNDPTVPEDVQGTFKAFTLSDSNGMQHLAALAAAWPDPPPPAAHLRHRHH
jgi:pullulanase